MDFILFDMVNAFWSENMTFIVVTFVFMALDIFSGVMKSLFTGTFSTSVMRQGFGHKLGIILAMCAVAIIQVALLDPNFTFDFEIPLFDISCALIIFMEFCSILENACVMNPQLENVFGRFFDKSKDDDNVVSTLPYN